MKMTDSQIFTLGYIHGVLKSKAYLTDNEVNRLLAIQSFLATESVFDAKITTAEEGK
jgi:hypothetical protein